MNEASLEGDPVLFGDSVHPSQQVRPAYGWIKRGKDKPIETTGARKRVNLMGVLNLETMTFGYQDFEKLKGAVMFKVIEPKYHCFCTSPINHFMDLVKSRLPLGLSKRDQNKATFILCDDKKNGVCGGSILLKNSLNDFPHELTSTLSDFVSSKDSIWKCMVFLTLGKESPLSATNEQNHFCQIFYRNLYNALSEFGKREETRFLCVSLDYQEFLCTEGLTYWPYIFELKPQNSPDGLFHGVLALTGSQYEEYQRRWKG